MLSPRFARIRSFEVVPSLPEPLQPLLDIAYNLWWSWHPEAIALFQRLDRGLWQESGHNPVKMLGQVDQHKLDALSRDDGFLNALKEVQGNLERHLTRTPWHMKAEADVPGGDRTIAYFCAEFGLTECFQIYSGGLGCLAGDHLKSASELGLPLIAVGLLYRNGFFQQYLNAEGWQQETNPDLDFSNLPVKPVTSEDGQQVVVHVDMHGRSVAVGLWQATVGRVPLYLLDTNQPGNSEEDRRITSQLYGGDVEMRIKQEIVLGIGGVRALEAINIRPDVCHMNEGHSAFLALERVRRLIEDYDLTFDEAREQAAASHVFTTHTPVPAGIDRFPPALVKSYFEHLCPALRLDIEGLLALGRDDVTNKNEFFSMATLALRISDSCNGVSKLHGHVSRGMWTNIWPGVPDDEVPITHVTNGVHARSWLSEDLIQLFGRYLGSRWQDNPADQSIWEEINEVPNEELWRIHERRRERLIVWARKTLRKQLNDRGVGPDKVAECADSLSGQALTIGFARRFATYKRGNLILRDPERLKRILTDAKRPVQFLIAGKAHPADGGGKDLIRQLVRFGLESEAGHRVLFLENYDIGVARYLVQGCDVWLNTPRRGMEASGTSGMKAALNGGLNCSILDGWWDEAYQSDLGWAIGRREEYDHPDHGDDIESRALYDLLENQIVPSFYNRDASGVPQEWVTKMKRCISVLAPMFNTNRMVQEYAEKLYFPALHRADVLGKDKLEPSKQLAHQKGRLRYAWPGVKVLTVEADTQSPLGVSEGRPLTVTAYLNDLKPQEVRVQLYRGTLDNDGNLIDGQAIDLQHAEELGDDNHRFTGQLSADASGRHGYAIRIIPGGELFKSITIPGLIRWDSDTPKSTPTKKRQPVAAT